MMNQSSSLLIALVESVVDEMLTFERMIPRGFDITEIKPWPNAEIEDLFFCFAHVQWRERMRREAATVVFDPSCVDSTLADFFQHKATLLGASDRTDLNYTRLERFARLYAQTAERFRNEAGRVVH